MSELSNTTLIDTPRLQMREFTLDDADAVLAFSIHPEVVRYTGDAGKVNSLEDAKRVIKDYWLAGYREHGFARYALICKQDNQLIGFCGIKYEPYLNRGAGGIDIGYRMLPDYWGQGLATEAVKACLDYAHSTLGVEKVYAEVMVENSASSKVLLKAGMRHIDSYQDDGYQLHLYETC
ncbi:GNAT family N-acetyltransferase [Shewanella mesophila]|uniref:GNAT family N-acetyltransferase n=1 Tax=Shewanella mesophila TaxID=2864208 RepID=UPI001C6586EA|nr:GNAT family N-acetyltransferase [Shewanella mesophila]QYJ87368.1 GNAT family N-acetyltransferase [Shewanella mesophila]